MRFGQNDKLLLSKSVKYFYAGIEEEINVSEYVWFLTRLSDVWSWPRRDNSMIRLLATCRCTVVVFVFSIYCVCFCICICSILYMYCICICWYCFISDFLRVAMYGVVLATKVRVLANEISILTRPNHRIVLLFNNTSWYNTLQNFATQCNTIWYSTIQSKPIPSTMMLLSNILLWMQHNNDTILPDRCDECSSFEFYQDYFYEFVFNICLVILHDPTVAVL